MRIFLSYAAEQRPIAESLTMALRTEGHVVFFDRSSLPGGQTFHDKIRDEIGRCDLFLFLLSPESVEERTYALSELGMMAERAPVPGDRVLPVLVAAVPREHVPPYLQSVNFLRQDGDLTADVLRKVSDIDAARRKRRRVQWLMAAAAGLVLATALAGVLSWRTANRPAYRPAPQEKPGGAVALRDSLSVFREPNQNAEIIGQVRSGERVTLIPARDNPNWIQIHADRVQGWAMAQDVFVEENTIALGQGFGFEGSFWTLFFTSPQPEGKPPNRFGIDARFADAVLRAQKSIHLAVFEMDNRLITDALIEAHRRGRDVRVVTDHMSTTRTGQTFGDLTAAGIRVVDRPRGGFMHHKFAIFDRRAVWTGSWNPTDGSTYANNENAIALQGADIAARFQDLFDKMFQGQFGVERRRTTRASRAMLSHGVMALFAPEDEVLGELLDRVSRSKRSITFLTFAFTIDELAQALVSRARDGVAVRGIFEKRLVRQGGVVSTLCRQGSGVSLRLDSNPRNLHHDVFVIDDEVVITGSLNFSLAALKRNDENVVFIPDATLARKYVAEFTRLWTTATFPNPEWCVAGAQEAADEASR